MRTPILQCLHRSGTVADQNDRLIRQRCGRQMAWPNQPRSGGNVSESVEHCVRGSSSNYYRFCGNRVSSEKFTPWFPSQDNLLLFSFLTWHHPPNRIGPALRRGQAGITRR